MKLNFIGSFTTGYVGETSDETHLARSFEELGHKVTKVPRDVWKAFVDGYKPNGDWILPQRADANIICKWPHFNDMNYIRKLRELTNAPVFYWTWDYMGWPESADWHIKMCQAADVHLTNEGSFTVLEACRYRDINVYYFPFDVADQDLPVFITPHKKYEVVFFGSHFGAGVRKEWLKEIAKSVDVSIFSWNYLDWQKEGLTAYPPVWGADFNRTVSESKICLQFSVNDTCWGYWSNRTGKVLLAGGFLLANYAPGMELFLRDGAEYFSSPSEAIEKINYYLSHEDKRQAVAARGKEISERFSSKARIKELVIFIERFLTKGKL